jgi:hypothetical protein
VVKATAGDSVLLEDGSIWVALEAVQHTSRPRLFWAIFKLGALGAGEGAVAAAAATFLEVEVLFGV